MESNINSDKELVGLAVSGSRKHQEQLYRLYADEMYNVCLMYSESEEDACDILQEAYIRVFRYLNTFQFESSLKTWIRRIIINTSINHYRKRKKDREFAQPLGENDDVAINDIFDNMNANDIVSLVNELPEGARMVLKLYAIEGYKHKEIAEIMEITEGTSKSQLNRAKSLLRETVEKLYGRKF